MLTFPRLFLRRHLRIFRIVGHKPWHTPTLMHATSFSHVLYRWCYVAAVVSIWWRRHGAAAAVADSEAAGGLRRDSRSVGGSGRAVSVDKQSTYVWLFRRFTILSVDPAISLLLFAACVQVREWRGTGRRGRVGPFLWHACW